VAGWEGKIEVRWKQPFLIESRDTTSVNDGLYSMFRSQNIRILSEGAHGVSDIIHHRYISRVLNRYYKLKT